MKEDRIMMSINKPEFSTEEIVIECASSYQDQNKKSRLIHAASFIHQQSSIYDFLACSGSLQCYIPSNLQEIGITKDEMVNLYNNKFAKQGTTARKYYDKLLVSMVFCPYCKKSSKTYNFPPENIQAVRHKVYKANA